MSGGDPICAIELIPMDGDIPIPILAVVDMLELLLTPSRESYFCTHHPKEKKKISGIETQIPLYNQYVDS